MIKKFKDFEINESFSQSKEYEDLLNSKSKSKSFFIDNLEEVSDLSNAKVLYYKYTVDSEDNLVNVDIEKDESYTIKYVINIKYDMSSEPTNESFFGDLNTISICVQEMIDRCSQELKVSFNKVYTDQNIINFVIHFDDDISTQELYNAYKLWKKFEDKEYREGMEKVFNIYNDYGIELTKYLDEQDSGDYKDIGFVTDDSDIYVIASYNRVRKYFTIDEDEIKATIEWYNSNNDDRMMLGF